MSQSDSSESTREVTSSRTVTRRTIEIRQSKESSTVTGLSAGLGYAERSLGASTQGEGARMGQITTPTFIIGLGGIGNFVVRLIRERYLSTDMDIPDTLRLRSIDTANQADYPLARPLPEECFTKVGDFDANGVVQDLGLFPLVKRWWKYPSSAYTMGFISNGAGAKRPVGRLVFFQEFKRIFDVLQADLAGPKRVDVQNKMVEQGLGLVKLTPRVFVIGSLAGGTCAGTFIDVAFLLRRMLADMGYEVSGASINGIFALPSVIHLASKDGTTLAGGQRQVNAYASLRDLDYLMRGWNSPDMQLSYPSPVGDFSPAAPLFNQLYLFTGAKQDGTIYQKQEDVLQRVAHFIFGQVALGTGEETLQTLDNFRSFFDPSQRGVKDGMIAIYSAFGVEWLEVPHQQLLKAWCERISPEVAARIADFKWGEQPLKNLDRVLLENLGESHKPYREVLDLAKAQVEDVSALSLAADLQPYLTQVQNAKSKDELKDALMRFEAQLPALVEPIHSLGRKLPAAPDDAEWVQRIASKLIRDEGFRIGGSRRLLEAAEAQLNAVAELSAGSEAKLDDVVKKCGGGLFHKIDSAPAAAWVRAKYHQQMRAALKASCGGKAASLAGRCRTMAHFLGELQRLVKDEVSGLALRVNASFEPSRENWLLDQEQIDAAAVNSEAVARAVASEVSASLALRVELMGGELAHEELGGFRAYLRDFATAAIEREAMDRTRRPDNAVDRLKNRLSVCQPMAQLIRQEVELRRVMRPEQVAPPLKMVVTSLSGEDRDRLDRWADEERRGSNNVNAFKIVHSNDNLRDDALHVSFGWPLWLFSEVRQCSDVFAKVQRENCQMTDFAPVLGELPEAAGHDIRPVSGTESRLKFAYAVVLGKIKPVRLDEFVFDSGLFGDMGAAKSFEDAFELFQTRGLRRNVERWLAEQKRAPEQFKSLASDRVKHIREQLGVEGAVPGQLHADLTDYAGLVEEDVKKIVVL